MWVGRLTVTGAVLVSLACVAPSGASTFILMSETDLAARSVAAVTGSVTDIEAAADPASGGINTYVHIDPDEVIFGAVPDGPLVLRETGGRLRGRSEWIFGSPEYQVGEEVLVFLAQNADGTLHTTGMSMGKFSIELDERGAFSALRRLGEGAAVWDLQRGELAPHPGAESYALDALLGTVRAARPSIATGKLTRHPITPVPPELSRAAVREHQQAFIYLGSPSRWFEPDSGETVPYFIDAGGDNGIGATNSRAGINDAFAAWSNVPTSDLTLTDAGSLAQDLTFAGCDGGNRIVFNDPFNEVTDPVSCSGVLAIGGFCASSETRTVNGTSFRRIRVGKITFNNGWSSCFGWNRCNLAEVATHELGHTLGFGHSNDFNATMYASAHFDGRCGSLRADDLAAINFVYPRVVTPTPTPTASPIPPTVPAAATRTATPSRSATPSRTATSTRTVPAPTTTATAIPPTNTPAPPQQHRVRGHIQYYSSDRGVPNVIVSLSGQTQDATQTSVSGEYEFDGVAPGSWELGAEKSSDFGNGVSPLDAAYVLQAIINSRRLDSSQSLACDASGDGQLSALDATRILQFSVGRIGRLPVSDACGSDWSFVPDPAPMLQRSVINPGIVAGACNDGTIVLESLLDEGPDQDFRAILFGDCTGNWDGTPAAGAAASAGAARVRLAQPQIVGTRVSIPVVVRALGRYNAVDLQVSYDAARLTPTDVVLGNGMSAGFTSFHATGNGLLRVAMASAEPIKRRFGKLMALEFTLASQGTQPGGVEVLSANVDEVPATIVGAALTRRGGTRLPRGR